MKCLAIVPARANSSRVPGKNIMRFAGKPSVLHAIDALKTCQWVDEIVVGSDSDETLALATRHGVTAHRYAPHVAKSDDLYDVCDAITRCVQGTFDAVILAYACVPVRPDGLFDMLCDTLNCEDIDSAAALCYDNRSCGGSIYTWDILQKIIADRDVKQSYITTLYEYRRDEIVEIDTIEDVQWANTLLAM